MTPDDGMEKGNQTLCLCIEAIRHCVHACAFSRPHGFNFKQSNTVMNVHLPPPSFEPSLQVNYHHPTLKCIPTKLSKTFQPFHDTPNVRRMLMTSNTTRSKHSSGQIDTATWLMRWMGWKPLTAKHGCLRYTPNGNLKRHVLISCTAWSLCQYTGTNIPVTFPTSLTG